MAGTPFFLPAGSGQRFCLYHRPPEEKAGRGAVVFIHPFAEEMNKSRRMAALQARALAAAGYGVLQVDLTGCGDSSGDFAEATWSAWVEDVVRAVAWLRRRNAGPLWLWGLRTGCLVAAAAAGKIDGVANFLFWQPLASGKPFLAQFLRFKTAGALLGDGAKGMTAELRRQLSAGEAVEVAGYSLSAALATGLEAAELAPSPRAARVAWLEVASRAEAGLAPVSLRSIEAWRQAGHQVRERVVAGQPFWQTVDTVECPALVAATLDALEGPMP
ncbi:MAG: hydrolase 2, exosortase system-associated [Rhodocyclaceae bacterium]|nr:hydrolase 2, exosortase system-associated [Rhodocyclaceae bacterium]